MFNMGWGELMIVFMIVLLVFGAKRLPELARSMGKAISEFKKGKDELLNPTEEPKKVTPASPEYPVAPDEKQK